ncbi:hypothetical protein OH76DRAFT_1410703 [Lentinus brumalis]|uniref:Uncharacterized protein n=1 Tax=Lentinus brumalis TaxID=2498619 RepID=A0A371CRM5_9APHY|nr:hypothetical protein OH76DRAFT_1410703 [Polyporus brumalis]
MRPRRRRRRPRPSLPAFPHQPTRTLCDTDRSLALSCSRCPHPPPLAVPAIWHFAGIAGVDPDVAPCHSLPAHARPRRRRACWEARAQRTRASSLARRTLRSSVAMRALSDEHWQSRESVVRVLSSTNAPRPGSRSH